MAEILEFSGIAWPNPGMWTQSQSRSIQGPVSGSQRSLAPEVKEDEDAHAHSPRRPSQHDVGLPDGLISRRYPDREDFWANQSMPPPQHRVDTTAAWDQPRSGESNIIRQNGPLADPFLEPHGLSTFISRRGTKRSSEDTPMPDVPIHEQSRTLSGMTGVSYEHKDVPAQNIATHEAIMHQLVEALSPLKSDDDRSHNPTKTLSSGRVFSKPSVTAQARAASRRATGTGVASSRTETEEEFTDDASHKARTKIVSATPCHSVQSKKEGEDNKENTPDHRVAGAEFTHHPSLGANFICTNSTEKLVGSTDSKRKRPLEDVSTAVHHNGVEDPIASSPSKKVSKVFSAEILLKDQSPHTPDGCRAVSGAVSSEVAVARE